MSSPPGARATFADLGVPDAMARNLAERGIDAPFPIQAATLPEALAGRDLCGRAPTGSGKTLAFGIPLITGVQSAGRARPKRPRGLVLVPTRELAAQVCKELQLLAKPRGPWVESFYGGTAFPRQVNALRRGVDIAVACPGRLADLINQGCVDLGDVSFVVLDEADRMADMGFLPEVERLLRQCADRRQTLLFSATLDGDVQVIIDRYMHDAVRHELDSDEDDLAKSTHLFWKVEPTDRANTAAALVYRHGPTVVFCRTKRGADRVTRQLESAGVSAAAIHGDRSQAQRDRALRSFHKGHVAALVATDVAARGIHVDNVACVIHYDPPADHKDYVHRSGRTARAGATGLVVTLVVPQVKAAVARLQRALELPTGLTAPDLSSGAARFAETAAARPTYTPSSGPSSAPSTQRRSSKPRRDRVESRSSEQRRGQRPSDTRRTKARPEDGQREDRDRDRRPYDRRTKARPEDGQREDRDRDRRPYDRRAKRNAPAADSRQPAGPRRRAGGGPGRERSARIEGDWWPEDLIPQRSRRPRRDTRPYDQRDNAGARTSGTTKSNPSAGRANRNGERPRADRREEASGVRSDDGRNAAQPRSAPGKRSPSSSKTTNRKARTKNPVRGRQGASRRPSRG